MKQRSPRIKKAVVPFSLFGALCLCLPGCGPSGTGLEDKGPPKGGPPASSRKPPGEVEMKKSH